MTLRRAHAEQRPARRQQECFVSRHVVCTTQAYHQPYQIAHLLQGCQIHQMQIPSQNGVPQQQVASGHISRVQLFQYLTSEQM